MTNNSYEAAVRAAEELNQYDPDALLKELGKRIEDKKQPGGEERSQRFVAAFVDASQTQSWEFLEEVGRRWYANAEAELMKFLCAKDNPERNQLTSGKTVPQVAASLATAGLLAALAAPPAWAIVATTIVAQKLAETGLNALCQTYYGKHSQS
jgi:hypothetical protein